ncbi:hypothetical protein VTO42DRAFT_8301 [Malbranchea cinnamomea]
MVNTAKPAVEAPKMLKTWKTRLSPKTIWQSLGLDRHTMCMMLKGALPPVILIAMHQSWPVANITQNFGYFSITMSIVAQCLQPRALFMRTMIYMVISTCTAASLCFLGVFCAVKAREHTTPPGGSLDGYNSSASAVSAIWFIFDIWLGNTIRTFWPVKLQLPMIAFSIFSAIAMTRAPRLPTLSAGITLVRQLLITVLLGFSIASAVSLFIYPLTSRGIVFHRLKSYPGAVKAILNAEIEYIKRSESDGPWRLTRLATRRRTGLSLQDRAPTLTGEETHRGAGEFKFDEYAIALKSNMDNLNAIHSAAYRELPYAKQEIGLGKLSSEDLDALFGKLRAILLSLSGIGMLPSVFRRLTRTVPRPEETEQSSRRSSVSTHGRDSLYESITAENHFVNPLCERLEVAAQLVNMGLQHAFIVLELSKATQLGVVSRGRKLKLFLKDEEAPEDQTVPGGSNFNRYFEERIVEFNNNRKNIPQTWASLNAFGPSVSSDEGSNKDEEREIRKEFFAIIFIGHLQDVLLQSTLDLVKFAETKTADGTMKRKRLIVPKVESLKQWIFILFSRYADENDRPMSEEETDTGLETPGGDPLKARFADPEHLPAVTKWQKFGNFLRQISHILGSEESAFGFRVAIASFSAAILAYLRQTQEFFVGNRVNWVVIVIVIGMVPTSGRSLFGMIGRIIGTSVSIGFAFAIYYMVAGETAGVIVLLYVVNFLQTYIYIKFPQFIPAYIIMTITVNLIISYELQVRRLGIAASSATGLIYYPIYLFAPYRLVAVAAGCAISFVWTIFPYATTAGSKMRKILGRSLFILANFYNCMQTSIQVWIDGEQGDFNDPKGPGHLLNRARIKLYAEEMVLLAALRSYGQFTKYEPTMGGSFPKKIYDRIGSEIQTILTSMDLMIHSTRGLERMSARAVSPGPETISSREDSREARQNNNNAIPEKLDEAGRISFQSGAPERAGSGEENGGKNWIANLAKAANFSGFQSHFITSVLYHLSAAVINGFSLPPYLTPPHPYPLARNLRTISEDLLDIRNVEDPSFSAFVAIEVLSSVVSSNLKQLINDVKILVGELDFGVYVRRHRDRLVQEDRGQSMAESSQSGRS